MKSFYAEIRIKNTNTIKTYHLLAKDFDQAALIVRAWIAGVTSSYGSGVAVELSGISSAKRRGATAEELL